MNSADAFPAVIVTDVGAEYWERMAHKHLPGVSASNLLIITYDNLVKQVDSIKKDTKIKCVVFDNIDVLGDIKSKYTQACIKLAEFALLRIAIVNANIPLPSLASVLIAIDRIDVFGGFWGFTSRYTQQNAEELETKLRESCYI
jgi:hypothetical protein